MERQLQQPSLGFGNYFPQARSVGVVYLPGSLPGRWPLSPHSHDAGLRTWPHTGEKTDPPRNEASNGSVKAFFSSPCMSGITSKFSIYHVNAPGQEQGAEDLSVPYPTWRINYLHCTLYTKLCTLHTIYYTLHSVQCTLNYVHCTLYTAQCTLKSENCAIQMCSYTNMGNGYYLTFGFRP